jgi:LmbE family N-acetylglucosaminyl deacetylase
MKRLLLIFAHPDDETVFAGGTACRLVAEGGRVGLCTATLGERGKTGQPPVCVPEDLRRVRQGELVDAASIMGVSMLRVFGYPDRGLATAPADTIRRQLVEAVRAFRPQVVVTFDPNGSNLHPDHVAVSRFAGDAVSAAADARWLPDLGGPWAVSRLVWTLPVRPWVVLEAADPALEPGVDFAVDVARWTHAKRAALRAHRTQHLNLERILLSKPNVEDLLGTELFRQAWGPALRIRPAPDLFEDVEVLS